MTQGTDIEVIAFVDAGIASGNIDMMRGIAETVTDLSDAQIKGLLFSGSLEVATATISKLKSGSTVFEEIAQIALTQELIDGGAFTKILDTDGNVLNDFVVVKPSCDLDVETVQDVAVRYAKDNIARVITAVNMDNLDTAAVSESDLIMTIDMALLSNQNAPDAVVTPFLVNESDALRAKAFVHANTDNAQIVAVMTADDAAGTNIDGFKLAMIDDLNSEAMIQGNVAIVTYLLGEGQSTPVQFAMFKNYLTVILAGGTVIADVDADALTTLYVG